MKIVPIIRYILAICLVRKSDGFLDIPVSVKGLLGSLLGTLNPPNTQKNNSAIIPGNDCYRDCDNTEPQICFFRWTLELYQVLGGACTACQSGNFSNCFHPQCVTADGFERGFMSINRQLPGPAIRVCKNDFVVVDLLNDMDGYSTSIHWHGNLQKSTPYMDGVPFLTQCPIPFGTTFRYSFVATEVGTHFYHSHSGFQKLNGLHGNLVVRGPKNEDPHKDLFDFDLAEHEIILVDWMHDYAEMHVPGLSHTLTTFENVLINGRGFDLENNEFSKAKMPHTIFYVTPGKKYRFRIIHSGSFTCPFMVQIENHRMTLIASDSENFEPLITDTFHLNSGERYDFVLDANQAPDDYFIRVTAGAVCFEAYETFAILRYNSSKMIKGNSLRGAPKYIDAYPTGIVFNEPYTKHEDEKEKTNFLITDLKALKYDKDLVNAEPDHLFVVDFENPVVSNSFLFSGNNHVKFMSTFNNDHIVGSINNISMTLPSFSLLTQPEQIDDGMFCNGNTIKTNKMICVAPICFCTHRFKVGLNSIVEMTVVDSTDDSFHPFHLHGHRFIVTEMSSYEDNYPANITRIQNDRPLYKDTVMVPNPGYLKIKFRADNPGFWLVHCHIEWHLSFGMGFILQVGEIDEMVKTPEDFPKCYDFKPEIWDFE